VRFKSKSKIWWLAVAIVVLVGPAMGLIVGRLLDHMQREKASLLFAQRVSDRAVALEREMQLITEELYRLRSFFQARNRVSRQEFHILATEAVARHPSIQALEWVPRISATQRRAHERQAHEEGLQGYQILAVGPQRGWLSRLPRRNTIRSTMRASTTTSGHLASTCRRRSCGGPRSPAPTRHKISR